MSAVDRHEKTGAEELEAIQRLVPVLTTLFEAARRIESGAWSAAMRPSLIR